MKKLYLGLRPKKGTVHYPVIQTRYLGNIEPALKLWPKISHIIFTSQTAVHFWPGPFDKIAIAIGPKTASSLLQKGGHPLLAPEPTQEGVISLLKTIPKGCFFWPRSTLARPLLIDYWTENQIDFVSIPLYETRMQIKTPIPHLEEFDEIIFTSPSTVHAFLQIFGSLPKNKTLTAIGPVTKNHLLWYTEN